MDALADMMFMMHVQQTTSAKCPFHHTVAFNHSKFDTEKLTSLMTMQGEIERFAQACFQEFKNQNPTALVGTVHHCPIVWVQIALRHIKAAYDAKKDSITFPNGCCTRNVCPINKIYEITLTFMLRAEEEAKSN
jgi:hypothetical protein